LKNTPKFHVVGGEDKALSRHRERPGSAAGQPGKGVILLEQATTVTKLEVANRELCTAIRMFFADGDAVAVHALACAASEIYERHGGKAGDIPATGSIMSSDTDCRENEQWEIRDGSRDFFKGVEKDLADRIVFSDEMNDFVLLAASNDCASLSGLNPPIEVQVYTAWFRAVYAQTEETLAPADPFPLPEAGRISKMPNERFPGARRASRHEQKRFGARLMERAFAGRL
jgi:hypothetical protein